MRGVKLRFFEIPSCAELTIKAKLTLNIKILGVVSSETMNDSHCNALRQFHTLVKSKFQEANGQVSANQILIIANDSQTWTRG